MSIFGSIQAEATVQVDEKIRLDASKSFITQDEADITLVEIKPDSSDSYITVSGVNIAQDQWYLDWIYSSSGTKHPHVRITTDGAPVEFQTSVSVVNSASDKLFCSDDDIAKFEPDIMKWLPDGKSSYNFIFRKVQHKMLSEIYKNRILGTDGEKLTKVEILDIDEVREWACYEALAMIFMGISNAVDDVFAQKTSFYRSRALEFMNLSFNILRADYNRDGEIAPSEKMDFRSGRLIRR